MTSGAHELNIEREVLGEEDLRLINALQIGPRLSWNVLGQVLERHPTSLAARWRKLEESGVAWLAGWPSDGAPG